jgi:DNA-binding LacI/PurR family transcriptional regulator
VDQGSATIGMQAAELALKIARKKVQTRPRIELVPPHLVVRASSKR